MNRFFGTTDAALRLGCSPENVRLLEKTGKLPAERMPNGRRVFRVEDVEALALEREEHRLKRRAQGGGKKAA